jgi:hypothetical protein
MTEYSSIGMRKEVVVPALLPLWRKIDAYKEITDEQCDDRNYESNLDNPVPDRMRRLVRLLKLEDTLPIVFHADQYPVVLFRCI